MSQSVEAVYDGEVLRPVEPLEIEPNTRVVVTVEGLLSKECEPYAFLDTLLSMHVEGPADWAENFEEYRTGRKAWPNE